MTKRAPVYVTLPAETRALATKLADLVVGELTMCWNMSDWSNDPPEEAAAFKRRLDRAVDASDAFAEDEAPLPVATVRLLAREIGKMPRILFDDPWRQREPTMLDALVTRDELLAAARKASVKAA